MIKQIQQRLILSQMGIPQWVQRSSVVDEFDENTLSFFNDGVQKTETNDVERSDVLIPSEKIDTGCQYNKVSAERAISGNSTGLNPDIGIDVKSPVHSDEAIVHSDSSQYTADYELDNESEESATDDERFPSFSDISSSDTARIQPFKLQAIGYNNWVIIIEPQQLNEHHYKLWSAICSGLRAETRELSFPICEGMDTAEIAQATLAGFVCGLSYSNELSQQQSTELNNIIFLTSTEHSVVATEYSHTRDNNSETHEVTSIIDLIRAVPSHETLVELFSLEGMIRDSAQKKRFWQTISLSR